MSEKILINGITLEGANVVPLLLKVKYWQSKGIDVSFFGNRILKKQIDSQRILTKYNFIELNNTREIRGRFQLIVEGVRRNIQALGYIKQFKNKYNIVYSISSVLDLLIFPYILQKFDKKMLRLAVFDNIVPISDPGNKIIRFLAWVFFRISLMLLKSADQIYAGSVELRNFLIEYGIAENKVIEKGQAVRNDLIKEAQKDPRCNIDALFVGRINETKGIYDMLEVLRLVKQKYPKFILALLGVGDEVTLKQYRQKIKDMNLGNNVQFFGYQSEENKFKIIKSSKVFWFLSTSKAESFGIALLEAVCCGRPAFAYDLPAYNYYKNNEIFIFKIHDYKSVAEKVLEVFEKKEFENQRGKLLIGKFSWEKIAEIEYRNFSQLVEGSVSPRKRRILVNGLTLEGANLVPLLSKVKYWQKKGAEVTFFGNKFLRQQIDSLNIIKKYNFIELKDTRKIKSRIQLIFEGLGRNIQALSYIKQFKNKFDSAYSISSVLDLLLFPYILKKFDQKIKWAVVFDNTVPFIYLGNVLIRFLAWLFFQISLVLLKKADHIFAVRPELKQYLLKRGFQDNHLIVTGNAIEIGFIKSAQRDDKYHIDALFIGRINEMKGIDDMLEVLKRVKAGFPDFQLALMGDGDKETLRRYREKIEEMGLVGNVCFLGYKTGLTKFNIIKSSKCFWFLSHTESYPVAPLEAVCCGLKAFVYDLEAYKMYKNKEVVIFKKRDYEAIAKKVIEIFAKKEFENKRGLRLFRNICWSWDKIAEAEYKTFLSN